MKKARPSARGWKIYDALVHARSELATKKTLLWKRNVSVQALGSRRLVDET